MEDLDALVGALAQRQHGRFSMEDVRDLGGTKAPVGVIDVLVRGRGRPRDRGGIRYHESNVFAELSHEHPFGKYYIDLCYPQWMIAIELDGGEGHRHEKAFEDDPIRNNQLVVAGWIVLHFTWARFVSDPAGVVREILAAIKLRSGSR
jgi:very-short-patch-repair endonuclease